jgi:hypothetical protein
VLWSKASVPGSELEDGAAGFGEADVPSEELFPRVRLFVAEVGIEIKNN